MFPCVSAKSNTWLCHPSADIYSMTRLLGSIPFFENFFRFLRQQRQQQQLHSRLASRHCQQQLPIFSSGLSYPYPLPMV